MNIIDMSCPLCMASAELAALSCPCCRRPLEHVPVEPMDQVRCHACKSQFPCYLLGPEEREFIAGLLGALRSLDEGRNRGCWPLVSFGWKDADLDASGCCGIKCLRGVSDDKLVFEVGGHKTFVASDCLDTSDEAARAAFDSAMQAIVCDAGYSPEWTGEEWTCSFTSTVEAAIVMKDDVADFEETARQIYAAAEAVCEPFSEAMAAASGLADALYEEMNANE